MIQSSVEQSVILVEGAIERRSVGFGSFAALPSNLGAIEAGMRFAEGTTPFVAVIGAHGWGKTHLLESVASFMRLQGAPANRPIAATLYAAAPERIDESLPLLLDDTQDAWSKLRVKQDLRRLLERRVKGKRPTLVTFSASAQRRETARFLPYSQDWAFQTITQPTCGERDLVVRQIADNESVTLSKPVVSLVSRHLYGNGRSIQGAVHTLKLVRPDWSRRADVCEACGVLMPCIHGEDGWDPRDVVLEAVTRAHAAQCVEGVAAEQVCAYILICEMGLSEYDVATFLGVSPTKAYAMANGVKLQLADPCLSHCVKVCKNAVVRSLDTETC